jgi:FixJ family two-component response regulator
MKMKVEIDKEDLLMAWNETEETICSMESLSDEEIIECKNSLLERMRDVLSALGKYVTNEDVAEYLDL